MRLQSLAQKRNFSFPMVFGLMAFIAVSLMTEPAHAIPVFARKYQTSCTTCHAGFPKLNGVGLAFKMNGYRFAREDADKVKQEPLQLGNDSYRDSFPNSILPSDIPGVPPISFEVQQLMTTNMWNHNGVGAPGPSPDFNFPTQINMMSAGTLSKNISFWVNGGIQTSGSGPGSGIQPYVERAFLVVNSLFAPDDEEDDNGMHLARGGLVLPRHFLNLRVGQFEPQAIAPYTNSLRGLGITGRLTGSQATGTNSFAFEPQLRGVEAYGVWRNYTSWAVGLVDGAAQTGPSDNNSHKDAYFRIGHKWWGYPLDGEVVAVRKPKPRKQPDDEKEKDEEKDSDDSGMASIRGQNSEDLEEDDPTSWLDYYRQTQFETGFFGYIGRNDVLPNNNPLTFQPIDPNNAVPVSQDNFHRLGADFQWQHHDLQILGTYMLGHDSNGFGTGMPMRLATWFIEAQYYFKPWIIGYARYEELRYLQPGIASNNIQRAVPGIAWYPIVNMAIRSEFVIDAGGQGTTPNQFLLMADYAY